MQINSYKSVLTRAVRLATVLLFGVGTGIAQQQVNLTAGTATAPLPDGSGVPMWGYSCGAAVGGSTATCAALNPAVTSPLTWSPVVITVPTGQDLQINLTNHLPTGIPTSLTIVGQLGGGLGTPGGTTAAPDHTNAQSVTWPIAGTLPGQSPVGVGTPPMQGPRVRSFSTEVAVGATTSLTWTTPRPGTYLIESGTHPSIQASMGLIGVVVVTAAPAGSAAGTAYPAVNYNADVPLIFSEIDPVQNTTVSKAVGTPGFDEAKVWSGLPGGCGNPSSGSTIYLTCYPPVVNYKPLYYLINGVAFDKTNASGSLFPVSPTTHLVPGVGKVLVRLVNAGSRMHVPAIVGSRTGTPAVGGFTLIAEDGNPLPGTPRVQNEVFMAAGKTYDVLINAPVGATALAIPPALPVYDRELSLSGNSTSRDAGMLAYIGVNGGALPAASGFGGPVANADSYLVVPGNTLTISDPAKGLIANDINVYGVKVSTVPSQGILTLNADGTFTYVPNAGWTTTTTDSFFYQANGTGPTAKVTLGAAPIEDGGNITCPGATFTPTVATTLKINPPGILAGCHDAAGYPLTVNAASVASGNPGLSVDANGGFNLVSTTATYTFTFKAQNSQGTVSANAATVTVNFPQPSGLAVTVLDGADKKTVITDYRWIIEEDRTFFVDPKCTTNPLPSTCPTATAGGAPPVFGTNFHTSNMPVVAVGCTGPLSCEGGQTILNQPVVCDQGNGICRPDPSGNGQTAVGPDQVALDPTKRYYISIFPGDAAQPFMNGYAGAPAGCSTTAATKGYVPGTDTGNCGHGMGGAPIAAHQTSVMVLTQPSPFPPATLSVFVFEDDWPLNGEHDAGGGIDVLSPQEPGLGGFQITLDDSAGATGDPTGTPTYDMFNQPLTNSLAGTIDPATTFDACPIAASSRSGKNINTGLTDTSAAGISGMIVTCPKYESDGKTLSPLAGQAVINNLYPGRYGVIANPGADRIARGEEWLQTNTLDGQKAHDSFMRVGEPGYFQEFGPAGYHVSIGFANPKIINDRMAGMCPSGTSCTNEVKGSVSTARMSRTPDERLYGSGTHDAYAFTQCYASLGDPDGADFAFVKCDDNGNFDFTGIPSGNYKLTLFDQWNDQVVDGISTPIGLAGKTATVLDMGEIAVHQWQDDIYTRTFLDLNGDGVSTHDTSGKPCDSTFPNLPVGCNPNYGNDTEPGLALAATNIRFPDGSYSNFNNTDLNGYAGFNEVFPLFNWYVVESDSTRYKNTGTHVVYDAGGPADGTTGGGSSTIAANLANTVEAIPIPDILRVPGAVYCDKADCNGFSIQNGPSTSKTGSTGRIDPPWVVSEGWQGFAGQSNFLDFGKKRFAEGENGGIRGHVVYASTRPFDDPQLLLQLSWEPLIPHVTINLYKEGTAPDGTTSLSLVDSTQTSSFDDWAQGFRKNADGTLYKDPSGHFIPNMNCPGQGTGTGTNADPFYYGLMDQPNYLDWYNSQHGGPAVTPLPFDSQYKCYDGMHNWNQLQPAPYDGMYQFPSTTLDPVTGKVNGTNCTICTTNPDATDPYRYGGSSTLTNWTPASAGTPMLPDGKYVVEVVVPPGFELVKEEDKNILIGDNFIAPVVQQFGGLGNVFIIPDQAEVVTAYNPQNPTQNLGRIPNLPSHESDTGSDETYWPCVGTARQVPDYISLFPGSAEVAPFAGVTRNLCDRKEVSLDDQTSVLAKFYLFTSTHIASKFTGVITDDFDAEFDPFSPQFGEKFAPAYLPVSVKDWAGNEVSRVYSDQFGIYNGMNYSTWEVNPPNPTGYAPTMMVTCMNDPGKGATPDALFQPGYSNFCYELPYMPGATGYFDTPVVPTSAFAGGYNHPDCNYPEYTPAIKKVISSDIAGPWVSASGAGHTLTITALGDPLVESYGYSGPNITNASFNKQKAARHYGFGGTQGTVTIGGVTVPTANITGWSDSTITLTVPSNVPVCAVQQQVQYGGPATTAAFARCGQLVIKTIDGKQSVDAVTVTIGGKRPTLLAAGQTIQSAIDAASPGDMIIVPPGIYSEMVIMWKPVQLQGVGAVSSLIDANPHPANKLDPWRREVACLFGLALNGQPSTATNPFDTNNTFSCPGTLTHFSGGPDFPTMAVDRIPMEGILGWDTTVNGNLAEQLIEPSLMGAYEGAGITVLGKGVKIPKGATDVFGSGSESAFPDGSVPLTVGDCGSNTSTANNPYPSNFLCNPSSIDGLTIQNSSQGGGGILVHAWGHNLQIANNRVQNNQGTLSGGITVGQGEHPDVPLVGGGVANVAPGSCIVNTGFSPANLALPYCYDLNVNVHNNMVTLNSSLGDELFSSTPAGAGGVTICNGSDYYKFSYNWVCGNMSTGDGAGVAHLGFSYEGDIEHNSILFNESHNPSITTNGGGLLVMGAPDPDPPCSTNDQDCLSAPNTITPSDGTGPRLKIDSNLIMGNSADSGSGGGLRLQHVNGTDVLNFPRGDLSCFSFNSCLWNTVSITNNIITNNVAGWDGAGVSLQDALVVNLVNNTIASNDSTASAGPLFGSLFAPLASTPVVGSTGVNCSTTSLEQSCPQVAGLVSVTNSPVLMANLPATGFRCPVGHGTSGNNGSCRNYSVPIMANNVIWENRSFVVGIPGFGTGTTNQQKTIGLYNPSFTSAAPTLASSQPQADAKTANGNGSIVTGGTGACTTASYWDIGVRGDTAPTNHNGGTLTLTHSVITDVSSYGGSNNTGADPTVLSQYCNGSRVPPELGSMGYMTTPGTNETNALPTPIFTLTPSATVDEGNNWVNLRWGPLAQTNPVDGSTLGNYGPASGSPVINYIPSSATADYGLAPTTDFFGTLRKTNSAVDAGAVEYVAPNFAIATVTGGPLTFNNVVIGTTSAPQTLTLRNDGGATLTGITVVVTPPFAQAGGSCGATLLAGTTCTINVTFTPTNTTPAGGTATITASVGVTGSPVTLSGTGVAAIRTASVTPNPLAFGNWATGTTSSAKTLTVSNTGNVALTGATITGGLAAPFSRPTGAAGGTCTATVNLAVGGTCTINLLFAPTTTGNFTGSPIVAVPTATVTQAQLTGTGVASRASVSILPNPLTITLPTGTFTGTSLVTLTNTSPLTTGASFTVSNVAVTSGAGSGILTWFFSGGGTDNCTGTTLAPGANCTVAVRFTTVLSPRGVNRAGTITFTDNAAGSPQSSGLIGHAN